MKWSTQADKAISRVPFFVRKRVRKMVEEEAIRYNAREVGLEHVQICRKKFLNKMEHEVKGFSIETCFGPGGCPNRAVSNDDLANRLEKCLLKKDLRSFLKKRVKGSLKIHHEFRVSVSDCPNACSRPQIVDVGIIGARRPYITEATCNNCKACVDICQEEAIHIMDGNSPPIIDYSKCLFCGKCLTVCPTGTLQEDSAGYRILVGGKLGRHPQLGIELNGIYTMAETLQRVDRILDYYQKHNQTGERLGDILNRNGLKSMLEDKEYLSFDTRALQEDDDISLVDQLIEAMKREFGDDKKRITHALRVLKHAREFLRYEIANPGVVLAAAILHDIGIKEAEKRHGSSAGVYQEQEGPPIARRIMKELGVDGGDTIEHVLRIVGSHHSANDIDTPEFRIIWDADWLVNIPDEFPDLGKDDLAQKIEKIFKTRAGRKRAYDLWLS
ncbi:MAG: 4Fe-4S binding protein [Thermodesulfobacteriota bacterium]